MRLTVWDLLALIGSAALLGALWRLTGPWGVATGAVVLVAVAVACGPPPDGES